MNKNQKIAIGCGAAGCLGLIVLTVLGVVGYFVYQSTSVNSNRNKNVNINRSSTENENANENTNSNANASSSEDGSSSSMSDDDKHKLYQAGASSQDAELAQRVWRKLGLIKGDGSQNDTFAAFTKDHVGWVFRNSDFLKTIDTPQKARAYVEAHMND